MDLQRNGVSMPVKHQSSGRLLAAGLAMCVVIGCGLPFTGTASPTPPPAAVITLPPTSLPIEPTLSVSATPTTVAAPLESAEPTDAPTGEAISTPSGPAGT